MKKLSLALGTLAIFVGALSAQENNALLWEITSPEGQTSYLFGTYHLIGAEYLEEYPEVSEAYESASDVVVETVIDSSMMMEVARMSLMRENTLWDFYDTAQFEQIDMAFQAELNMGLGGFVKVKPVSIAMMYMLSIARQQLQDAGMDYGGLPLDVYFAHNAKKLEKEVHALETMKEQLNLLYNSDPLEEQATILLEMVLNKEEGMEDNKRLLKAYGQQDLTEMWAMAGELGDTYGDMSILVDQRNQDWMVKLQPILNNGNAFIAVGALHLPGELGLINLLKEAGYQVKPVTK